MAAAVIAEMVACGAAPTPAPMAQVGPATPTTVEPAAEPQPTEEELALERAAAAAEQRRLAEVAQRRARPYESAFYGGRVYGGDVEVIADSQTLIEIGGRGVPFTWINGRPVLGAAPLEAFTTVIDDELARDRAAVGDSKAKRRGYYERVLRGAPKKLPIPKALIDEERARRRAR